METTHWPLGYCLDVKFYILSEHSVFQLAPVVSCPVDGGQELGSIFSKTSVMVLGTAGRLPQSPPGGIDPASQSVLIESVLQPPGVLVASAVNLFLFASAFFLC